MGKAVIKRENTVGGGGQEAWWQWPLDTLRVCIGTFAHCRACRYSLAMIILCICRIQCPKTL